MNKTQSPAARREHAMQSNDLQNFAKDKSLLVMSSKELNASIETAISRARTERHRLHVVLCSAALHAQMHGDTRPVTRYVTGLKTQGAHIRVNAMVKVLAKYTPLHFDTNEMKFRIVKVEGRNWNIDGLIADPFYSSKAGIGGEGGEWDSGKYLKIVASQLKKHGMTETEVKQFAVELVKSVA